MRKSIYGVAVFSVAFSVTLIGQVQPPTTANGILEITAGAGGGRLTIDGSVVADVRPNAKYQPLPLKAGRHTVRLEKDGYLPVEEELVVRPNVTLVRTLQQHPMSIALNTGEGLQIDTGVKDARGADIMWATANNRQYLIAQGGAKLALMNRTVFERTTLNTLKVQLFSHSSLRSTDLIAGTVVGILTRRGTYGKIRIDRTEPTLAITWATFK